MLLWGSMAICAKEGFGTSSVGGAFTIIGEFMGGGSVSWDANVVDGGSG